LPQLRRASNGSASFRLSVRIVSASAPALGKPGVLSQRRPRLEVSLGDVQKDTELADYVADDETSPEADACARECPWRFGDTLTFSASVKDVLGPGLRFRLRAHSDIFLGPVQLQLQRVADLGEGSYSIRQRILPACVRNRHCFNGIYSWESPMLPVPLSHVKGGLCSDDHGLGEAVAHVTAVFKFDMDPEALMEMADDEVRPVSDAINRRAERVMRLLEQPVVLPMPSRFGDEDGDECREECVIWDPNADMAAGGLCSYCLDHAGDAVEADEFDLMQQTLTGAEIQQAVQKALRTPAASPCPAVASRTISSPDLAPEGWISRRGPNGRLYWHHRSLGPAPWEQEPSAALSFRSGAPRPDGFAGQSLRQSFGVVVMNTAEGLGPIVSPNLPDDGWVSQVGPGGRKFWHNRSLGPAPWETQQESTPRHPRWTTL
jgi:hypothetical protein